MCVSNHSRGSVGCDTMWSIEVPRPLAPIWQGRAAGTVMSRAHVYSLATIIQPAVSSRLYLVRSGDQAEVKDDEQAPARNPSQASRRAPGGDRVDRRGPG